MNSLKVDQFYSTYNKASPLRENRFSFLKTDINLSYQKWPRIIELCSFYSNGLMEKRGGALISIEKSHLEDRFKMYFDKRLSWDEYSSRNSYLTEKQARFVPEKVRANAINKSSYSLNNIVKYSLRPFDDRWAYYSELGAVWNCSRTALKKQTWEGNSFLVTRPASASSDEGCPMFFTKHLGDNDSLKGHACYFPILLQEIEPNTSISLLLFSQIEEKNSITANLSSKSRAYLTSLSYNDIDLLSTASLIWHHTLAVVYSEAYRTEQADGLKLDWPRIPLPLTSSSLDSSAALGSIVASLLDTESAVDGVTYQPVHELQPFGRLSLIPTVTEADLVIDANWGYGGHSKPVMPGPGITVTRDYSQTEREALNALFLSQSIESTYGFQLIGDQAIDVYLNATTYWSGLPSNVWEFVIGGYQVLKKWLSYREHSILGRELTMDEARYITQVVRRILKLILLTPQLNQNYKDITLDLYEW